MEGDGAAFVVNGGPFAEMQGGGVMEETAGAADEGAQSRPFGGRELAEAGDGGFKLQPALIQMREGRGKQASNGRFQVLGGGGHRQGSRRLASSTMRAATAWGSTW